MTEILSQFEINAEMDISKNQWRSTGGMRFTKHEDKFSNFSYTVMLSKAR